MPGGYRVNAGRVSARTKKGHDMKGFLIDTVNKTAAEVEFESKLETYYKLLHCSTIDIAMRRVGDRTFDVVCDDEGLMLDKPVISAISKNCEPMLVGSLLFVHHDAEGNTTGLSDDDVSYLRWHVRHVRTVNDPDGHPCMTGVDY